MTPGLALAKCTVCEATYFPMRLICAACGSASWGEDMVHKGTLEQMTTVRHAAGRADWQPRFIACVRTDKGQVINAGLEEPLSGGTRVALFDRDGSPIARKLANG